MNKDDYRESETVNHVLGKGKGRRERPVPWNNDRKGKRCNERT